MYRKKNVIILVMIVAVMLMALGYATFATKLNINATGNITSTWNIYFSNITEGVIVGSASNNVAPSVSGTTAYFDMNLELPGDSITYEVTLTNGGTVKAIIENIDVQTEGSAAIVYSISGIKVGDKLESGEEIIITVKVYYDDVMDQPEDTSKTITVKVDAIQDAGQTITENDPEVEQLLLLRTQLLRDNAAQIDTSLDFSKTSTEDGTKGLYYTSTNTEENKTTYYFRGAVDNNYVSFAGFYWRIVRINEDGSIRLIYQGESADATESNAAIGTSPFNSYMGDNTHVGYMQATPTEYKDAKGSFSGGAWYQSTGTVKMATSYDFDSSTGTYTLVNPIDGYYSEDYYNYYTCMSATDTTCILMLKLTEARMSESTYQLWAAEVHAGYFTTSYEESTSNVKDSDIKKVVDEWYKNNLLNYSKYLADSGFCNDRSLYVGNGYGNINTLYGAYNRLYTNKTPQFACPNEGRDLFTTGTSYKGNRALDYPIGLLTMDEASYAGGVFTGNYSGTNTNYYLDSNAYYWTMTPMYQGLYPTAVNYFVGKATLSNAYVYRDWGVRPVINLNSEIEITSGNGTSSNPYVIKTN